MGYFATIVPNTALAKSATGSYWSQGWRYLVDFVSPYWLWIPVALALVLTASLILPRRRRVSRDASILVLALLLASLVYVLYVVHLGGDFMHARMLLPALLAICLPVAALEVSVGSVLVGVAVLSWAIPCAVGFRTPYRLYDQIVNGQEGIANGIANEANFWRDDSHNAHPVHLSDYARSKLQLLQRGEDVARAAASQPRVLQVLGLSLPLATSDRTPIVYADFSDVGVLGYAAGTSAYIDDKFGLGDPIAARLILAHRGRPGHERELPPVWVVARFAAPESWPTQHAIPVASIQAANTALNCGRLRQLLAAVSAPMTPRRFASNIVHSLTFTRLKVPPDPTVARDTFCQAR